MTNSGMWGRKKNYLMANQFIQVLSVCSVETENQYQHCNHLLYLSWKQKVMACSSEPHSIWLIQTLVQKSESPQ